MLFEIRRDHAAQPYSKCAKIIQAQCFDTISLGNDYDRQDEVHVRREDRFNKNAFPFASSEAFCVFLL